MSKTHEGFTIVCLPPQEHPIYFVVPRVHPDSEVGAFMVDENSCPTNWLRNIEEIIIDGDTDPHGLFEYVRDIEEPDFVNREFKPGDWIDPAVEWRKIIPEAFPPSPPITGET